MIERQVIVTWYKPEEKLPPSSLDEVLCTVCGKSDYCTYDHVLDFMGYDEKIGWFPWEEEKYKEFEVIAWCDLKAYGLKGGKK